MLIVVHALAMFDDLIVNATATNTSTSATAGGRGTEFYLASDYVVRRVTFNVSRWLVDDDYDTANLQSKAAKEEVRR